MAPSSFSSHNLMTPSLESIRKPWKKQITKPTPTPPRVYRVDSSNFRKVVQKLTGAPQIQASRLRQLAPPPLNMTVSPPPSDNNESDLLQQPIIHQPYYSPDRQSRGGFDKIFDLQTDAPPVNNEKFAYISSPASNFGLVSPSWMTWCALPILSPGTLASLEASTVM